jgi:hypothetical protein
MRALVASLVQITGEDFGENQDAWQAWWNTKGRVLLEESKRRGPPGAVPQKPAPIPGRPDGPPAGGETPPGGRPDRASG